MSKEINFYFINNFGGGAQTVERAFSYINYLNPINNKNIHLQLNFRYLNFREWIGSNYSNHEIDELNVVFNFFKNVGSQELIYEKLLPLTFDNQDVSRNTDIIYEPSKIEIVQTLIPKYINTQIRNKLDRNRIIRFKYN